MFIRKAKITELVTTTIIKTARQCGRNLSMKDQAKIKNEVLNLIERGNKK